MKRVHLGFEVGSGHPVEIPLAHTFVTGQTQLSGKTTALRAIVERSRQRALAFVTKRGETFEGRRIAPYLPREGDRPIPWRLVETILASALGQRNMKYERLWIVNAAKGARSLADVRSNVTRLQAKAKGATADVYMLLGEYLDLVLPEMRQLAAVDALDLQPGLNVMDLSGVGLQLQALVIRAALERINQDETGVLTVFPEAWEFAPRGRSAPAKDEAIAMARKGAVLGNFLLCDSQDLAGVDTVVRQAASVWLLGVQRELNELTRTLQMIPAGVKRPRAEDVAQLELGQFFACWGRHAIKVYVQPTFMARELAQKVATGVLDARNAAAIAAGANVRAAVTKAFERAPAPQRREDKVNAAEASALREENARLTRENADLRQRIEKIESAAYRSHGDRTSAGAADRQPAAARDRASDLAAPSGPPRVAAAGDGLNGNEALYQQLLARLVGDAAKDPILLKVLTQRPELQVHVQRQVIEVDGETLRGRIARLMADGLFEREAQTTSTVLGELARRGFTTAPPNVAKELGELARMGFLTRDNKWYRGVPDMKVNIVEGR
ncbi:MAG TPA: hypothetical protein VN803_04055 [Gemmatimonadales bacterium]|nr:hypothetical protein [Gemmatimonadales bacterium]